ncbi:sulfite exporter TauE/SafE family protein [Herpetosiphon sp. NSE202]|uniref:sulfite exporter TauE/SafE family protein n=1 Tax=Herpetosiphon sp. NSE202 TaxID=3351349 RepID=UPI003624F217
MSLIILCAFALLAGFIDAVAGGGGLIQLPPLLILQKDVAPALVLGTNKFAAVTGTATAAVNYNRRVKVNWRIIGPGMLSAALCSWLGARAVSLIRPELFRPIMLLLIIAMAIYTFKRKDFGSAARTTKASARPMPYVLGFCGMIGFYDGIFGPGTGSLLMFAFVGILGFDFLQASASTKIINVTTNVAALVQFLSAGQIIWHLALPMAVCNIVGGIIGSRMALAKGSQFVRVIFLVVVVGVILRYGYDIVQSIL